MMPQSEKLPMVWNISVDKALQKSTEMTDRNPGIMFSAHFQNWINPVYLGKGTCEPDEYMCK